MMSNEITTSLNLNGNGSHELTGLEGTREDSDSDLPGSTNPSPGHILGKVASPPNREATSEVFQFWVKRGELVEKTQIVRTESRIGNQTIQFYAVIDEVYRQSRKKLLAKNLMLLMAM